MTDKIFRKKVMEFLNSEIREFGIEYEIEHDISKEETSELYMTMRLKKNGKEFLVNFKFQDGILKIAMDENLSDWKQIQSYNWLVRYFWILVAPVFFGGKNE
jgi:hypothetical protein